MSVEVPQPLTPGSSEWLDVQIVAAEAALAFVQGQLAASDLYQAMIRQEGKVEQLRELRAAYAAPPPPEDPPVP